MVKKSEIEQLTNVSSKRINKIEKIIGKDRHVIHQWLLRYNIKRERFAGFKKAILRVSFNREEYDVKYGRYQKINNQLFRVYYTVPTELFSYIIGLIMGDGHIDERKIYIVGGIKESSFADKVYSLIVELGKNLGNRKVDIHFYKDDKITSRKEATSWRIYFYWSALANMFKTRECLEETFKSIWNNKKLFDAFTAGFFDTDGYFVTKNNKPERIGLEQSKGKWWFELFCDKLKEIYTVRINERTRNYKIKNRGKVYTGS